MKKLQPRQTEFGLGTFESLEIVAVFKPNYLQSPEDIGAELEPMQVQAWQQGYWCYADLTIQARFEGIALGEIVRENFIYGQFPDAKTRQLLNYSEQNFWIPVKNELLEDNQHNHAIFEAGAFLNRAKKLLMEAN